MTERNLACPDEVDAILADIQALLGYDEVPAWATRIAHVPHLLQALWINLKGFMQCSELSPLLQELVIFTISRHNRSTYCMNYHAANALTLHATLSYQELVAISDDNSNGIIPDHYRTAIRIAIAYAGGVRQFNADDIAALTAQGFSDTQITELAGLILMSNAFNMYALNLDDKGELCSSCRE
ncbi:carboxymuconolactone decarboxylase family protein [Vibrio parahaemolyticus]|uniref:carboxymuconolactone decarboxylase family protein n=1 Tax=Vibrio parahaemolyticus TaxID=670 RepID=UPI003AB0EEAC